MGRKIPGRKHRGIRDPEKQAAIRFESIKNKINAPPSNPEHQEISKSLQRVIDLKDKVNSKDFKTKKNKTKENRREKTESYVPVFKQNPGETDRQFIHRMNKVCSDVVKEAAFEKKYGVDIKRNEDGEIEGVVKRKKDELELILKKAKKKNKEKKGTKKKKSKVKQDQPRLSKWQKRKMKLDEKKNRKDINNVDEFQQYKDKVKFGEVVHAPPTLPAPRRVEKDQTAPRPGNKNLLLKSMIESTNIKKPALNKPKSNLNKIINKAIDKKEKGKNCQIP